MHFICSTDDKVNIIFENQKIRKYEKLLGDVPINDIYKKAGLKLNALARISPGFK